MSSSPLPPSETYAGRVYENEGLAPLVEVVGGSVGRVLDLGCGAGANLALLERAGNDAVGLTISEAEAAACAAKGIRAVIADLDDELPFAAATFDAVLLSHVVEHVAAPDRVIARARRVLRKGGVLVVAIPNALYYKQRYEFARGRFRYADTGLMDRTHLRFFDVRTAAELIESSGFEIIDRRVDGAIPSLGLRKRLPAFFASLDRFALRRFPGMFGYQFIFKARPS